MMDDYFGVRQVSKRVDLAEHTVRKGLRSGAIQGVKLGRDWFIADEELHRWYSGGGSGSEETGLSLAQMPG